MNNPSTTFILPKAGVVIVNYNNFSDTIKYINDYLLKQENIDLKIVVVDNASPNESFKMLENEFSGNEKVAIIANNKNSGYASGNNIGIKYLEGSDCEYFIISNNDIEIDNRKLISELIAHYQRLDKVAFISPVMLVNGRLSKEHYAWRLPDKMKEIFCSSYISKLAGYWYIGRFYYNIDVRSSDAIKVDCLAGSFFLGSRNSFRTVGYLDENTFLYYEETILGLRVNRKGLCNYLIQNLNYNHFQEYSVNTSYNIYNKHRFLLESKVHFWKNYMQSGRLFISVLKLLFWLNKFETLILKGGRVTK